MHPATLLAAAAEEHPLIDMDFTVLVQAVLFIITALLATKLLFKPYLRMRDERAAGIEGARQEAANMSAQADAQLAEYEQSLAQARARAAEERRGLRAEAATHEAEVLEKTRVEAAESMKQARETIDRETEAARQQLAPRGDEIGRSVAKKLLGREVTAR